MFCENCGTKLEEGAKFCAECGTPTPIQTEAVTPEVAPEPEIVLENVLEPETVPEAEPTNEPPKKKKKKKKAPVIIAIILVVVMLLACLIPCIIAALTGVVGVGGAAVLGIFNSALGSVNLPTFDQSQLDSLLEGGFNAGTLDGSVGGGLMAGTENNDDTDSEQIDQDEQIDEDNYFEHIDNTAITIGELTALPEYASWNEDGSLSITVNFINGYTFELYDICIECIRVYNANGDLIAENNLGYVFSLDGLKYHSADFTLGADSVYNWNSDITNITIEIDHNS